MSIAVVIWFLVSLIVSTLLGYLAASFLWPRALSQAALCIFAPGVGFGICSLIFFTFRRPMFTVEFALLLALAAAWLFHRRPPASHRVTWVPLPLACLFLAGI